MLLCIDIGNTNIMLGLYENEELGLRWRLSTDHERMADEFAMQLVGLLQFAGVPLARIEGVALASGVPTLTRRWVEVCHTYLQVEPLVVKADLRTGITILYDNPASVGADRIVDAVAAYHRYGGPLCIVDFGTATTFDCVTPKGEYLGGVIAPGIEISAEALFSRASRLHRVEIARPERVVGRNPQGSMQSGIVFGYAGLVDGLCGRLKAELDFPCRVLATGGLAHLIAPESASIEHVDDHLTLTGLRLIHERNSRR